MISVVIRPSTKGVPRKEAQHRSQHSIISAIDTSTQFLETPTLTQELESQTHHQSLLRSRGSVVFKLSIPEHTA